MKKILLTMAAAMMSLVFVSCEKEDQKTPTPPTPETSQLQKPSVSASVEGTTVTVSWNSVENAVSYTYSIQSTQETIQTTQVVFEEVPAGSYEIKVKADGDNTNYTDSEWAIATFVVEGQGGGDDVQMNPALEPFIGTFTLNFATSMGWEDAGDGYVSPVNRNTPVSQDIEVVFYNGDGATGNEVIIYGFSALDAFFESPAPMLAEWSEENQALLLVAGQELGDDGSGAMMTWLPVCTIGDQFSPVTGQFVAYAIFAEDMSSFSNTVELSDGSEATVFSLDIYGVSSGLSVYDTETPYNAGDFTMVSASASGKTFKAVSTMNVSGFSPVATYNVSNFSVVK